MHTLKQKAMLGIGALALAGLLSYLATRDKTVELKEVPPACDHFRYGDVVKIVDGDFYDGVTGIVIRKGSVYQGKCQYVGRFQKGTEAPIELIFTPDGAIKLENY